MINQRVSRPPKRKDATTNKIVEKKPRSPSPPVSILSSSEVGSAEALFSEEIMASLKGKPVQLKNAVMMLNEMFPPPRAPQYKVTSQTGPPNNPTFSMVCCIQDQTFAGGWQSFTLEFYHGFLAMN